VFRDLCHANGNSIEQTLGCAMRRDLDWHYDIQHVAAQVRQLRGWRRTATLFCRLSRRQSSAGRPFARQRRTPTPSIASLVETLRTEAGASRLILTGHSGGGSFIFGYIEAVETIPDAVERIVFLDANYAYSDEHRHGDKLLAWLRADAARHLVVVAYDDREVTLNGKKVVGPTGGTYRATQRMIERFRRDVQLDERPAGQFVHTTG